MQQARETLIRSAQFSDVEGIARVCSDGWRATYADLYTPAYIEWVIGAFYNLERLTREVRDPQGWDGWLVAEEGSRIVGAGGGGLTGPGQWQVFVLYLDPQERRRGLGTKLLDAMTGQALEHGATEQWVSAAKGNEKGLPFYKAKGFEVREEFQQVSPHNPEPIVTFRMARLLKTSEVASAASSR